jgi:hypothetical protein
LRATKIFQVKVFGDLSAKWPKGLNLCYTPDSQNSHMAKAKVVATQGQLAFGRDEHLTISMQAWQYRK